jgi:hypothetical protein
MTPAAALSECWTDRTGCRYAGRTTMMRAYTSLLPLREKVAEPKRSEGEVG